jgi:hypothetical protein
MAATLYTLTSPPHAGAAVTLIAPGGTSGDTAPTGSGIALLVVNGATPTTVTLVPLTFDGLVVTTRSVVIGASTPTLIPLPASVYGTGTVAVGYGNVTTLTGGATGVAVITIPGN